MSSACQNHTQIHQVLPSNGIKCIAHQVESELFKRFHIIVGNNFFGDIPYEIETLIFVDILLDFDVQSIVHLPAVR